MNIAKMIKGYVFAVLSAVIYGCMPLMAKYIYEDGVNPLTLVFLRNALSLPSLALLAYLQKKTLKIPLKALPSMSVVAVMGCCLTPMLLFSSYNYIASGTATVFHFVYPAVVVLAGMLFFGKSRQWSNLLSVILCVVGVSLFYTPGEPINVMGMSLALLSGIAYAVCVIALSSFKYNESIGGFLFNFYVAAISSVIMFAVCLASGQLAFPQSLRGWVLCILFALAITTGAVVLFQQATFNIGGERTSILSALEPITSVILGMIVFHEQMSIRIIIGTMLVIAASLLIVVFDMKIVKKAE